MKIIKLFLLAGMCFLNKNTLLGMNDVDVQTKYLNGVRYICDHLKEYNKDHDKAFEWGHWSINVMLSPSFANDITKAVAFNIENLEEMVVHLLKAFSKLAQKTNESFAFDESLKNHPKLSHSKHPLFETYRSTSDIIDTLDTCIIILFTKIHKIGFRKLGWSKETKKQIRDFITIFTNKKKQKN